MADEKKRNLTLTKRAAKTWTAKEIDQLLEYKATGFKDREIGELLGRRRLTLSWVSCGAVLVQRVIPMLS